MSYLDDKGQAITVDQQEVMKALSMYIKGLSASQETKEDLEAKVTAKYEEFIRILEEAETSIGGDVLSHLKSRELFDRREGDYLTDPIAGLTTGDGMGMSSNANKGLSLEVNLGLDVSGSMANADGLNYNRYKGYSPTGEGQKNPIIIAPRLFFASMCMRYMDKALSGVAKDLGAALVTRSFTWSGGSNGSDVATYNGDIWLRHPSPGGGTYVSSLLRKLGEVEAWSGNPNSHRLDLVITDGEFWVGDYESKIQFDRLAVGGSVQTVIINICGEELKDLPDTFICYAVDSPQVLVRVIQQVIQEFLQVH